MEDDSKRDHAQTMQALSRNVRIAVPIASIAMLLLLAITIDVASPSAFIFIPVFLFMVVLYVISSIYLFKTIIEKDTPAH